MSISLLVPPQAEPLTLDETKRFLRVDNTNEDADIVADIAAAREWCEERTGRRLVTQTVRWTFDLHWRRSGVLEPADPDGQIPERYADRMIRSGMWMRHQPRLRFPVRPCQSIVAMTYRLAGTDVAFDSTQLRVLPDGAIIFNPTTLPPLPDEQFGAVTIDMKVGYGDSRLDVPDSFRRAMKMLVGHWYENRGMYIESNSGGRVVPTEMEASVSALLKTKRTLTI